MRQFLAKVGTVFYRIFGKDAIDDRTQSYRSNFYQLQNMMTQNTLEADKALATFSIAALAALAALNQAIFIPYGWLSFITLVCFIAVIFIVIIGYAVSNQLLIDAQKKLTRNYLESPLTSLNKGIEKPRFAKLSRLLNITSMSLFLVGTVLFVILLGLYIKGVE